MNANLLVTDNSSRHPAPKPVPLQLLVACVREFETIEETDTAYDILRNVGLSSPEELATHEYKQLVDLARQINRLLVPVSEKFLAFPQLTDIAPAKHAETVQAAQAVEILVKAIDPSIAGSELYAVPYGNLQDQCLFHISGDESRAILDKLCLTLSELRRRAEIENGTLSPKSAGFFLINALYPRLFEQGTRDGYKFRLSGRKFLATRFCEFCVLNCMLKPNDRRNAIKSLTLSVIQRFLNLFLSIELFENRPFQPNLEHTITCDRALSA